MIFRGEDDLERAQADGLITPEDADEVRRFAAYLRAAATDGPAAWREHYPEDYARAVAERERRATREGEAAREQG